MSNPSRRQVLSWFPAAVLLARASTLAAGTPIPVRVAPLPLVQPASFPATSIPGAVQPLAPGALAAPALPQILIPGLLELHRCEYASNGFLEAAHAVLLLPTGRLKPGLAGSLARTAVQRTFAARPGLSEVTVSVYRSEGYQGFGGPSPLLTVSVPSIRLDEFVQKSVLQLASYDRAWINPDVSSPVQPVSSEELEVAPVFVGSTDGLAAQRIQQLAAQLSGGVHGGLFFHGTPLKLDAALSFDDAPHPIYALLLLDTLSRANVKATFFCIGRNARAYPYYVKDIAAQGHEIANHTFHHVRLTELPVDTVEDEVRQCSDVLTGITGKQVRYFRPPGGRYSPETLSIARSLGLSTVFWTDDPADFNNPGQTVLETRLARSLRAGGIVLLHDNVLESLRVLPQFAQYAAKRQIRLGTVSALAALS